MIQEADVLKLWLIFKNYITPNLAFEWICATNIEDMDIGTKTRCFRQSKRHDLLTGQWEQKRYQQHRDRITHAEPRIDVKTPVSDSFQHVKVIDSHTIT